MLELGYAPLAELGFTEIAQPHMRELVRTVHESASLAVLDGDDIRYMARVPTVRIMSVNITIGTRFPAYATSMGRVLLAGLTPTGARRPSRRARPRPLTRHTVTDVPAAGAASWSGPAADGYALVDEELEEGLRSLAVPVRDAAAGWWPRSTSPPTPAAAPRKPPPRSCFRRCGPPPPASRPIWRRPPHITPGGG